MVDIEIVRENYRRMTDEQLVRFAKLEAQNLSLEAFHALKDELIARNIGISVIEELDDADVSEKRVENAVTDAYVNSLFEFAIEEKSRGTASSAIYQALLKKNLDAQQALMIIEMIEETSKQEVKNIETEISIAWISLIVGAALCLFTINQIDFKFLIGVTLISASSIKLANNYSNKKKLTQAVENCKEDTEWDIKNLYQ